MLKLYGGARSRASIVQWYLEEMQLPYEFVLLDMQAQAHLQPDFLAINPVGKVPAIVDGDFRLWESGAILLYLADKYGGESMSAEQRALQAQWVLFANATLGNALFLEANREREMPRVLGALETTLADREFLTGDRLTVADVAVGSLLGYAAMMLGINYDSYPAVKAYLDRLVLRPAFQKAIGGR